MTGRARSAMDIVGSRFALSCDGRQIQAVEINFISYNEIVEVRQIVGLD